ncbi:MAG: hypothetical protein ACLU0O_13105 [Collinsella sp.]
MFYMSSCKRDASLSSCSALEDTPSGVTVMYDCDGSVIGVEVFDLSDKYCEMPSRIHIDARAPFDIELNPDSVSAVA